MQYYVSHEPFSLKPYNRTKNSRIVFIVFEGGNDKIICLCRTYVQTFGME